MLLEEWQRRAERNTAQLKALFRAGDSDADGLLTYDEFLSVVRTTSLKKYCLMLLDLSIRLVDSTP